MRYQLILTIVLIVLITILLFSLFYGSQGKRWWNSGIEGFSNLPELSDKEQELFEDLSNNKLSEDDIMKLVNSGVINDNLITKFLYQIDSETYKEKFEAEEKKNGKEKFDSSSSIPAVRGRKLSNEVTTESVAQANQAAQEAKVAAELAMKEEEQANTTASIAMKKVEAAEMNEKAANATIASVVEKAQAARNELAQASEVEATASTNLQNAENEMKKAEDAVKKEEKNVADVKKEYGNSNQLDNAKKRYDKAKDTRGRVYAYLLDVTKQVEDATVKKNEAVIKANAAGKEEEQANTTIASVVAIANAARNEEIQANKVATVAARKAKNAKRDAENKAQEARDDEAMLLNEQTRMIQREEKRQDASPSSRISIPDPVSYPSYGMPVTTDTATVSVTPAIPATPATPAIPATPATPAIPATPAPYDTNQIQEKENQSVGIESSIPEKIPEEPKKVMEQSIKTTSPAVITPQVYNEYVARLVVEPFCGTWNGVYASKI